MQTRSNWKKTKEGYHKKYTCRNGLRVISKELNINENRVLFVVKFKQVCQEIHINFNKHCKYKKDEDIYMYYSIKSIIEI